ncbi:hypothetical protein [Xylanimonas sp. McL0601]|uniref:hypothetical protein n=1 Tax=Xylanimonas sp. McL0601 TaxID=3414739 RepID=UPI003CE78E04
MGNTVNGCTAQWFSTAFSMNCINVSAAGRYQDRAACQAQLDKTGPIASLAKGTTKNGVSSGECTFKVTGNTATYLGQ